MGAQVVLGVPSVTVDERCVLSRGCLGLTMRGGWVVTKERLKNVQAGCDYALVGSYWVGTASSAVRPAFL